MKYLKTYEEISVKYKVGDYVYLNINKIEDELEMNFLDYNEDYFIPEDPLFKIYYVDSRDENFTYNGQFFDGNEFNCNDSDILRFSTPAEIEEFEEKKAALKYNI